MDRNNSCFFTGHRKLPERKIEYITKILEIKIKNLIENNGVTNFIAGGALGFDTLAAKTVIRMKEEYPDIRLFLYLPCYNQNKMWSYEEKYEWHMIMSKVDDYKYITKGNYTADCMKKRNFAMANDALYGLAYCVLSKSGTGMTMHYAEETGCIVDNIADEIYGE